MIALLFDHLWQSTLFAGCVALLTLGFAANGAGARFWLWFAASVKFLLPFAALTLLGDTLLAPLALRLHAPTLMRMAPVAQPFSGTDPALIVPDAAIAPVAAHFDPALLLLCVWALGFAVLGLRWLLRWSRLRALVRDAADLDMPSPIAVKSSASRIEPGLVGIIRPVILLPQGIGSQLSPEEMHTILAHELTHWRRRDNLMAAIHMLVEALFWFFPLVWWLGARLNAERERACDESVLAAGGNPIIYAEGILKVCRFYLQSPLACAAGVSGGSLKQRMDVIMENRLLVRLTGFKKSLLAMSAMLTIGAPLGLSLLTTAPLALAAQVERPHPGTEAALRHQIEGWEKKQPDFDDMTAQAAGIARVQQPAIQAMVDGWGPLKKITFKEFGMGAFDLYRVEFEHGTAIWGMAPLLGGKIQGMGVQPATNRTDKGPAPGLADAIRRHYEGLRKGAPAYDLMGQMLLTAVTQQLADLELDAENLGALKVLRFVKVNALGWDVYDATFENGTSTWTVQPLVDGKLTGLQWTEIHLPKAPAHPGTQASLRRYVESLEKGQPNYDDMSPAQAQGVRLLMPDLVVMVRQWGAMKSISFEGGGHRSMDIYDVSFEHAKVEWNIAPLQPDGKANGRNFRVLN